MIFVPCIVIQFCNVNQQNVHFKTFCFNSIPRVFYMFRISRFRHKEDCIVHAVFMAYISACTNGLPDDEHIMFETCRSPEEFN